jgi:iron complex outermembrane recepter protein
MMKILLLQGRPWKNRLTKSYQKTIFLALVSILMSFNVFAQLTIQGKTTDKAGATLPNVSVVVKNTKTGTVSDVDGAYKINVANTTDVLIFTFIGYVPKEVVVGSQTTINVSLEEDITALDEVVVTGVFDKRTRMESSVAISVLNAKQLERIVPSSGIDLLKNIPGVYVNTSRGEVGGSVNTRGLSVGGGFYYVSMQEDGLPIMAMSGTALTDPLFKPDGFLRADVNINRVEVVRGGTASILGANAPGGIFNYVSKTGGQKFAAEVRTRFGLEGDGKNPLYRIDMNFGGPLSKDKSITYNIGGFYRYANGPKYPGYPLSNGGQIKANIVKNYKSGSLKLYGKFLNDNTAQFEFTPTVSYTDPKPAGKFTVPGSIWNRSEGISFDTKNVGNYKDYAVGLNWEQHLGKDWTVTNNARISEKVTLFNTTSVVFPFRVDQATFYGVSGNLGHFGSRFGKYEFYDPKTGKSYGSVNFNSPASIVANNLTLPGSEVMPNGLFYNPSAYTDVKLSDFIDQLTITKKLKNMSFTGGAYIGRIHVTGFRAGPTAQGFATIEDQPKLVGIKYTNAAGATFDITNPDGITTLGGTGVNTNDAKAEQTALFLGHNWEINKKLNLDWGLRYEIFNIDAKFSVPTRSPDNIATGGADGSLSTLFDIRNWKTGQEKNYSTGVKTLSYSAGLNYKLNENMAVYARYSQGQKSPDLGFFLDITGQQLTSTIEAEAQNIKMLEAGLKIKGSKLNLYLTPFYNLISGIPNWQTFTNIDASYYAPPRIYQKVETKGVEIEANYQFTKNFSLRAVGTLQTANALEYSVYLAKTNGPQDDEKVTYDGNQLDNVAPVMLTLSPTYNTDKFYASINFQYMGKRWANVANAFELPAFSSADLNLGYTISKKLSLSGTINNLINTYGILGWASPGGFPASLDTQGFTKAMKEANPDAIYSTLSIMPRSYFLTLSYKF